MSNQRGQNEMATPAEPSRVNKIKKIHCQTSPKARSETKSVSGAVSNRHLAIYDGGDLIGN